jgi:hypothetical protein
MHAESGGLKAREGRRFPKLQVQTSQSFRVIFRSHLPEHIACGNDRTDQPLVGIAKRDLLHSDGKSRSANRVLNLAKLFVCESEAGQ